MSEKSTPQTSASHGLAAPGIREARYRTLFEQAPMGILYADAESYYLDANENICRMLGYTREELIGMHASDIVAPEEVEHIRPALDDIATSAGHQREWRFRRKDGSTFPAEVIATKFADGTLLGMVQDITTLRERERELARMSRLYSALSQVNQAIVWTASREELFERVCRMLVEHGGLRMAWIDWHDADTLELTPVARHGSGEKNLQSIPRKAGDDGGRGISAVAFRSGQHCIDNDLAGTPEDPGVRAAAAFPIRMHKDICATLNVYAGQAGFFQEKEIALLLEAATDVSFALENFERDAARSHTELTLLNEKRFSDTMIESMPGIVYFYDLSGRFLRWNRNFETVSGYGAAEIAGMHPLDFFADADRELLKQRIGEVFEKGESSVEAPFLSKNGSATPYFFTGRRVQLESGPCLVGVGIDITERIKRRQLEAQVRQTQKMEAIGQLAGGIAHDFNNILTAILGNTQLAMSDIDAAHPAQECLQQALKSAQRAASLVRQILTFARYQPQARQVMSLDPTLQDACTFLRATIPATVTLECTAHPDTPTVLADATQMYQTITNLCTNAWHALDGRPGRVDIRLEPVTLDATAAAALGGLKPGSFARLSVRDDGKGMDAVTLERIFNPFFTTKAPGKGTGLGLSVVHGIVQGHEGAIRVRSEPGQGATFEIYLPAAQGPAGAETDTHAAPRRGQGQRILYLDDEEPLVTLAKRTLGKLGYRLNGYTRAEEALRAFRAAPDAFDLVITDLNMPGASGIHIAAELLSVRPDLPIVLCSGHVTEELKQQALNAGIRAVLYKPNTMEQFSEEIQRLTRKREKTGGV